MAEPKQTSTSTSKPTAQASAPKASLAPASESGDPAVHKLLAELEAHRMNSNAGGVKVAVDALAELGYEAS